MPDGTNMTSSEDPLLSAMKAELADVMGLLTPLQDRARRVRSAIAALGDTTKPSEKKVNQDWRRHSPRVTVIDTIIQQLSKRGATGATPSELEELTAVDGFGIPTGSIHGTLNQLKKTGRALHDPHTSTWYYPEFAPAHLRSSA